MNLKISGVEVVCKKDLESRIYAINNPPRYQPFLKYGDFIEYDKYFYEIIDKVRDLDCIDLRKKGYKGRIIYDVENNELIKFESPDEISNKYQDLELFRQFNNLDESDILTPNLRYNKDLDNSLYSVNDIAFDIAFEFMKSVTDINKINNKIDEFIKDIINFPLLKDNFSNIKYGKELNCKYRIFICNDYYEISDNRFNSSPSDNLSIGKNDISLKNKTFNSLENLDSFKENEVRLLENIFEEKKNKNITEEDVCKELFNINSHILTNLCSTVNDNPVFSFRLDTGINPDEWNKEVIDKTKYCLKSV